jgi:anti-sigma B factor antagonist
MPAELFDTRIEGNVLVVIASEDVGRLASLDVRAQTDHLLEPLREHALRHVVIDLEKAEYFGTYMLELMHALWRRVRRADGRVALCNVSDVGREVLHVSRLDTLWPIYASPAEAMQALEALAPTAPKDPGEQS